MIESPLLAWYDANRRHLPWRSPPGQVPDPYHILLSEVMLQQTTVVTVKDYFIRFTKRWPTLLDLATADLDDVYHYWQGLGYYSRAKNLHRCVQNICERFGGIIPKSEELLLTLPGVGPYTAAAVAAIAFDYPTVPVDGNIIRVFSRLFALQTPLPKLKDEIFNLVKEHIPSRRSGDFAQALMDLGATICKPKSPLCHQCPIQESCQAFAQVHQQIATEKPLISSVTDLPRRKPKAAIPRKQGIVFWYEDHEGKVCVRKRPAKGLLANLMEIPGTSWQEGELNLEEVLSQQAPSSDVPWQLIAETVQHTFTHFHLTLRIVKGKGTADFGDFKCLPSCFDDYAFPILMRKVIEKIASHNERISLPGF